MSNNYTSEINLMIKAAEKAAINMVRDFGELEKLQVSRKGFKNFVTNADRKAEDTILYLLSKARPETSFICEESGIILNENKDVFWVVDPIDGTTNFMRGIPFFSINIALQEGGQIVAGVTLDPLRGDCYQAYVGGGAFIGKRNRARVSPKESLHEAVVSIHSAHGCEQAVFESGAVIRKTGSIALDLAYLASGRYDAVVARNVRLWDIASGVILIREAGGFVQYVEAVDGSFDLVAASSSKLFGETSTITGIVF